MSIFSAERGSIVRVCFLVALVLAAGLAPVAVASHDAETADTLEPGSDDDTLTSASDEDWYRLVAPVLTHVQVTVVPDCSKQTVDVDIELYQGDGVSLIDVSDGQACTEKSVSCWTNANQQLFARAFTSSGQPGDYTITHAQTPYVPSGLGTMPTPLCTLDA